MLFETEFHSELPQSAVYLNALSSREIQETSYIHDTYFGSVERREEADDLIAAFARKWKLSRMSVATRSLLRLAVYEMVWGGVPPKVAINEAMELSKVYDDAAASPFINGILNQIAREKGLIVPTSSASVGEEH